MCFPAPLRAEARDRWRRRARPARPSRQRYRRAREARRGRACNARASALLRRATRPRRAWQDRTAGPARSIARRAQARRAGADSASSSRTSSARPSRKPRATLRRRSPPRTDRLEILFRIANNDVNPRTLCRFRLGFCRHRAENLCAAPLRHLREQKPDPSRGRMYEHTVAGLDRKRRMREIVGRHPLKHDRGRERARDAVGHGHELPRRHDRHLGIGPRRHRVSHTIPRPNPAGILANGLHHPRRLPAPT